MPLELLPAVRVAGSVAAGFKQKLSRCRQKLEDELARFDCCRQCNAEVCVPCRLNPEVQAAREQYHRCVLRAWHGTLNKVLPEVTIEAIVSTLPELGGW
jgi:hypothetical protein